jgi:hypothetical protein
LIACSGAPPRSPVVAPAETRDEARALPPPSTTAPAAASPVTATNEGRNQLLTWLKSRLPEGGEIVDAPSGSVGVVHVLRPGDSFVKISEGYLDLTEIYFARDLNKAIHKENSLDKEAVPKPGDRIVIPAIIQRAPKSADEERLGWPEDRVLRGLYVRGATAASPLFIGLLDRMSERGLNLIVLDAKDYDGLVTYRSNVPLVLETGAAKHAPIRDLPRTIRFVHARGIRVAMRISCFEDEFMAKAKPSLAVLSKWKQPYPIGWLDPANDDARKYILELVQEAMDAGVDEVQLDYVRYPVLGIKNADFDLTKGKLTKPVVIRDFVRKVHELTQSRKVPLSLDIFGIVAEGQKIDIDMLGQDPALLAPECEALSPMVYPSHYRQGYQGFDIPGNHPEIVGIGTKKILAQVRKAPKGTIIRPWLQAVNYNSPDYGPQYLASEIRSAGQAGGTGWLMWNPAQTYTVTWSAVPVDPGRSTNGSTSPPKNLDSADRGATPSRF